MKCDKAATHHIIRLHYTMIGNVANLNKFYTYILKNVSIWSCQLFNPWSFYSFLKKCCQLLNIFETFECFFLGGIDTLLWYSNYEELGKFPNDFGVCFYFSIFFFLNLNVCLLIPKGIVARQYCITFYSI